MARKWYLEAAGLGEDPNTSAEGLGLPVGLKVENNCYFSMLNVDPMMVIEFGSDLLCKCVSPGTKRYFVWARLSTTSTSTCLGLVSRHCFSSWRI
jgi:hypothetical protein